MGLVISENIVKAFSGIIGVKSKFGKGTKFAFGIVLGRDDNHDENMIEQDELRPARQHLIDSHNSGSSQAGSKQVLKDVVKKKDHLQAEKPEIDNGSNQLKDMPSI